MALEGEIQAVLAPLAAGGCYPMVAPEVVVKPYIVYQVISNVELNTLEGSAGLSNRRVQVDVWADTYGSAKSLSKLVAAAMTTASFVNIKLLDHDSYEPDVKTYGVSMDYSVWGES